MVSALLYGALNQPPPPPLPQWTIEQTVTLQGDTGKYSSCWGPNDIKIVKDSPDRYCYFKMIINNDDGTVSFRADNGQYLSHMGQV